MKQFKSGDAVRVVIKKDNLCYGRLNGLVGKYGGHLLFGHSVFIPELGYMIIADDVEPIGKTLLEILVDELPKRGGWPQWAAAAASHSYLNKNRVIFAGEGYSLRYMKGVWSALDNGTWGAGAGDNFESGFCTKELATDHATKIVTREEYEQAVKPTRFEQSVKAANELAIVMLENMAQRLTDACSQREEADDFVITAPSDVRYINSTVEIKYPAGYHIPERPMPWLSKGKKSEESKLERIERLHNAFKSAKAALDAEFKPIIEIMDDLELGDYFTVNHNKDGLVNFRVTKVISELDGQSKDRKLFVTKLPTGEVFALTGSVEFNTTKVS
ncbi:MAG: hypothetical protein ACRC4K_14510 [Plesiomonas shigelloides]